MTRIENLDIAERRAEAQRLVKTSGERRLLRRIRFELANSPQHNLLGKLAMGFVDRRIEKITPPFKTSDVSEVD